ncbi:MAG: diheme cytochrome c [Leptothrix ochracea]|uniref:diheme cytochrome c n=1 Tax=Leptothrix ochracea TaxID=735331 RepID=UPI0034E2677C
MNHMLPTLLVVALMGLGPQAWADYHDHDDEGQHRTSSATLLPAYQQECGSCHIAFPPNMLPAASWTRLMGTLGKHFGTDAAPDAAVTKQISRWLQAHAESRDTDRHGRTAPAAPVEVRITQTAWFQHTHHEVPATYWKRASIKSPSNCTACHGGADQGDFDEHRVRIPR